VILALAISVSIEKGRQAMRHAKLRGALALLTGLLTNAAAQAGRSANGVAGFRRAQWRLRGRTIRSQREISDRWLKVETE